MPNVADSASSSSIDAGSYFFSVKPSPVGQRPHFVGADPVDQPVEMLADPRLGPAAVGRLEQHVDGAVELLLARLRSGPARARVWPALKWRSEAAISVRTGSSTGTPGSAARRRARRPRPTERGVTTTSLRAAAGTARRDERESARVEPGAATEIRCILGAPRCRSGRHVATAARIVSRPHSGGSGVRSRGRAGGPPHLWPSQSSTGRARWSTISPTGSAVAANIVTRRYRPKR